MSGSPATLTAIAYAAHQTRDRDMEREAVRRLREEYGIELRFMRNREHQKRGATR
jgi:hypothetical protein